MKRIISLVLSISLLLTMVISAGFTTSAATTFSDIDVDLSKVYRIGTDEGKGIVLTTEALADGSLNVNFKNYVCQLVNADGTIPTSTLWANGGILALKNSNDEYIILQANTKYSINIIYDVTSVATEDATYQPQVALVRNNHASNTEADNGTVIYTAKKHGAVGSYSISYQTTPSGNQPLRIAFGGHGAVNIKAITIRAVSQSFGEAVNLDLTNVEPIGVSNPSYSNLVSATATTPLTVDVNATYAYNATLFDGTNTWLNTWTTMYLKTLIPLKYDAENYVKADDTKTYQITVNYKVTATSATEIKDYPEIGIVYNNGVNLAQDNGSKVIAAARIAPADAGVAKTLTAKIDKTGINRYPLRLALTGKGSFEISSVTIKEYSNPATVTLVTDGITTVDYYDFGAELPTPAKEGYTFAGWFDANGVKHTSATTATFTAAFVKTSAVDLTKTAKIDGTKATMNVTVPEDASAPLIVGIQGFNGLLMDKETEELKTNVIWTGGASVALKYSDDSYVSLSADTKYLINVEYDVTNIGTYDRVYHPQIGIIYNSATTTQDNGQYVLAAKKESAEIENASISAVVAGIDAKALRLAFDGQGAFNVKSVTITELSADTVGLNVIKYTDSVYSTDEVVLAVNGDAVEDLPRTLLHNFGGWYNGEEKASVISGEATLTAKWFGRGDVTLNDTTDVIDLIRIKKALADASSDILYDVDRDDTFAVSDIVTLRKILLGIDTATIGGSDIAAFSVTAGDDASF